MSTGGATPILSERDLEDELRRIHARKHRSFATGFFGMPEPGLQTVTVTPESQSVRQFRVVHATCELAARRALHKARGEPVVVLFDYEGHIPFDITSRLAGGKVRPIPDERRLARLFGAGAVSPDVLASPLKGALLTDGVAAQGGLQGLSLDLDTAWRRYLERMVGFPVDAPLSEERLTAHCAVVGDPMDFRPLLERRPKLREALHRFIGDRAGPVARLAWRAWERGAGKQVAAFAFFLQPALSELGGSEYLQAWLGLRLAELDGELRNAVKSQSALLDRWGRLADGLELHLNDAAFSDVLGTVERWASDDDRLRHAVRGSRYLAIAAGQQRETLAMALEAALDQPDASTLAGVRRGYDALRAHRASGRDPGARQLKRALMAARLAGWLVSGGPDRATAGGTSALAADVVADLATAYAREGGFGDWARSAARGPPTARLDQAIAAVIARADAARDAMDERFARALPDWAARRRTDRVVPIDQALDRFGVELLEGGARRKLLVVLLDGMAWSNAVELLMDLESKRWGPVRWQPKGPSADLLPPMLASLPTLTEISRAAFFAGRVPEVGDRRNSSDDPDRFEGHAGLRKLLGRGPQLLLRVNTEERPGHASKQALDLVASDDRVVAFVVNAIDDQLKVGAGLDVQYLVDTIKALPDLLAAAAQAQRAVLLVADHGHVRGDRFDASWPGGDIGSARARELAAEETPNPHEVAFDAGVWRTKKQRRLALLYREVDTYGSPHGRGTHGGAALAEVVTPAFLIASDDLSRSTDDPALDLRSFPRPRWWDMEIEVAASPGVAPTPPARKKVEERPANQLTIPLVSQPPVRPAPQTIAVTKWAALLRASAIYTQTKGKEREVWDGRVIVTVDLLADHGGAMPVDVFAARLGLPTFRVPSVVSEVSERLNLDQHQVLLFDRAAGQVRLELALLEQLFSE
jgi:PglZ domain